MTGNVTVLRNPFGDAGAVLSRVYLDNGGLGPRVPEDQGIIPRLLDLVTPVHAIVPVGVCLPGCPPPATRIRDVLEQLLAGKSVHLPASEIRFG